MAAAVVVRAKLEQRFVEQPYSSPHLPEQGESKERHIFGRIAGIEPGLPAGLDGRGNRPVLHGVAPSTVDCIHDLLRAEVPVDLGLFFEP